MLGALLKVLSAAAVVVGIVTGVGTIVGWTASASFGEAGLTALRLAGLAYLIVSPAFVLVYFPIARDIHLLIRILVMPCAGFALFSIVFWGLVKWQDPWFFIAFGCAGTLFAIGTCAVWSVAQQKAYKASRMECPDCAEIVKSKARVCRHCGYRFQPAPDFRFAEELGRGDAAEMTRG